MRLGSGADGRSLGELSYCTNVHPGEDWASMRRTLEGPVRAVKAGWCPAAEMAVGLRVAARAAEELDDGAVRELAELFEVEGMFLSTINGFVHGAFHGRPVKAGVYEPGWDHEARATYTLRLARIAAALVPTSARPSISTVPLGIRGDAGVGKGASDRRARCVQQLRAVADELAALEDRTGVWVSLGIEPEPGCALETGAEAIDFLDEELLVGTTAERERWRRHVGLCLDACHAAVAFEDPLELVAEAERRGVSIPKLQVSSALVLPRADAAGRAALAEFRDEVYLHQVVAGPAPDRPELRRWLDLPEALADASETERVSSWRIHYHVPVFAEAMPPFATTRDSLERLLRRQAREPFTNQLEVETYTWGVLPPARRGGDGETALVDNLVRELRWSQGILESAAEESSR